MANLPAVQEVRNAIEKMAPQFKAALPAHVSVEKFVRVTLTAVQNNPSLLNLNRSSLFMACLRAAQDGLLPDGRQGAIVGFRDQAQWMPMVAGLMVLARNSGQVAALVAQVVHERDRFVWRPADTERPIEHEVPALSDDRGKPIGAYALARLTSGEVIAEVMTRAEIEKVRAVSRSKDGPAWTQWWGEMARKTVLRRLIKRLPLSTDLDGALAEDDDLFMPPAEQPTATPEPENTDQQPGKKRPSRLQKVADQAPPDDGPTFPPMTDDDGVIDVADAAQELDSPI